MPTAAPRPSRKRVFTDRSAPPAVGPYGEAVWDAGARAGRGRWRVRLSDEGAAFVAAWLGAWGSAARLMKFRHAAMYTAARLAGHTHADLEAAANAGLVEAAVWWDPDRGEFATHLGWQLLAALTRVLNPHGSRRPRPVAGWLDRPLLPGERETLADVTADGLPCHEEAVDAADEAAPVLAALARMPERDREVLRRRFGLGAEPGPETLEAIAASIGRSKELVRQIQCRALAELRDALKAPGPEGGT